MVLLKSQHRKQKPQLRQEKQQKNKISKYIKKRPKAEHTKRDNTYVFEGFYDRLKSIDVKHAHSLEAGFTYDRLLEEQDLIEAGEDAQLFKSNFIQLLRTEKANNKTSEFNKVYNELEKYCFSYPLLVHNKGKIIDRLLHFMEEKSHSENTDASAKLIQTGVIDLFIALVKDFRADIYQDFLTNIMPRVIGSLDISNVTLLDKVFTMLSFAVKYLTKSIKEDIVSFYNAYTELLSHKNKFVRKFAAQAFCYVVRKLPFDEKLLKVIISPVLDHDDSASSMQQKKRKMDQIMGISELLFEVAYGASEGLHSKAKDVMVQVLSFESEARSQSVVLVVRSLFQKLVNEVDTEKHQLMYDTIVNTLDWKDNKGDLEVLLQIFTDVIKLKYGRRVSPYGIVTITEALNTLLQGQQALAKTQQYPLLTKKQIASTLGLLFYFKHHQVISLFQKSGLDLAHSKTLFNHHIYQLSQHDTLPIISAYFSLFLCSHAEVSSIVYNTEEDIDWNKLLGLKLSSKNQVEFSKDSHKEKLQMLIKSFNKFLLKQVASGNEASVDLIAMFEVFANQLGDLQVALDSEEAEKALVKLAQSDNKLTQYVVYKFIARCKSKPEGALFKSMSKPQSVKKSLKIQLNAENKSLLLSAEVVNSNFILRNYPELKLDKLNEIVSQVLDTTNFSVDSLKRVPQQIEALKHTYLSKNGHGNKEALLKLVNDNSCDIVILKAFNSDSSISCLKIEEHQELFTSLSRNLQKNQRELRMQSLRALVHKFVKLESNHSTDESKIMSDVLQQMLLFEETEISFTAEKTKILQIERIQSQLENDSVPQQYLQTCFDFLIGIYWIKFTPLFDKTQQTIQVLVREHPQTFAQQLFSLIENLNYLTQIAHDNDTLLKLLEPQEVQISDDSLVSKAYQRDSVLREDFMEMKDYFYNVAKSLCVPTVMDHGKDLRPQFFALFYSFIDCEYTTLYLSKAAHNPQGTAENKLLDQMTYANMVDSDDYKKYRKQAYSKLYCFLELLQKADSLRKIPQVQNFQNLMLRLLNTPDTKLQKIALECILKSDAEKGVLRHYRKLLEGFTDDLKFKDMVQVVNFGSQANGGAAEQYADEESKKESKANNIPKLAESHRLDVLPIVIRLLLSKLIKKKGAINQKTVHTRRTIVYQFMSQLNPQTELKLFFNELLSPFDLDIDEPVVADSTQTKELRERLSQGSFSNYLNYIGSLSVIIKQMGSLLIGNGFLERITRVFIQVLSLTKSFIRHLKLSLAEDGKDKSIFDQPPLTADHNESSDSDIDSDSDADMHDETAGLEQKDTLYRFVGHQSKVCLRKGLGIVKQLYDKYGHLPDYVESYSEQVFKEIIEDQLEALNTNFISDRSQLLDVLTVSWSSNQLLLSNFLRFPTAMPALLGMLREPKINPEVYEMHLLLIKNIILKSIQGLEDKKDMAFLYKKRGIRENEEVEEDQDMHSIEEREMAQKLLQTFISEIAGGLNVFCGNHLADLKKTMIVKTNKHRQQKGVIKKRTAHEIKNQTIKDLIFVMSEVSTYLPDQDPLNLNFLDMIISVVSMKNLHQESVHNSYYEELLHFGCKSLAKLIPKVQSLDDKLIDRIFQLFLSLKSIRIRQSLSLGLQGSLGNYLKAEALDIICNLNKLKRGAADLELDYDSVIKTIQSLIENDTINSMKSLELQAITYSVAHLLENEEFSVRDFANHFIKQMLIGETVANQAILQTVEGVLLRGITRVNDEMVLKTQLDCLRHLIHYFKQHPDNQSGHSQLASLAPLVNLKDDNDDFFSTFLAIKMKTRQRSLRLVASRFEQIGNYKAIQQVIMPLVNYIIFGDKAQKQNRRNTISYSKEEKRGTLEEALNVYQAFAQTLKWPDYFRLLKNLLFKLNRILSKASFSQAEGHTDEDMSLQEKTVVKCICRVLNGFHFEGITDSLQEFLKLEDKRVKAEQPEDILAAELDQVFQTVNPEEDGEKSEESEKEEEEKMVVSEAATEIQRKLYQKILPILERHMTDAPQAKSEDPPVIRSFVVLSIAKLIRRLPLHYFQHQLGKLISTIVSKGLRQKDTSCRDKGRKALLKLLEELSPRSQTLTLVFQEMKEQLQKGGYQLHTFVFSVHFLLQQLHEMKLLKPGDISTYIVDMLGEKFLEELFKSNSGVDGTLEDIEKVKIKESKSRKAIPVFEMFSQYIDFRLSFFSLIAPVVSTLEENPTITKIQMCEELLNKLSSTLLRNGSVKAEDLLMFMYTIIQRGVNMAVKVKINDDQGVQRDYGAKKKDIFFKTKQEYKEMTYSVAMSWKKTGQQLTDKKTQEICGRVLGSFGLQCMKRALKQTSIIVKAPSVEQKESLTKEEITEDLKAKLDPFVSVLLDAFKTYHNPIIVSTLHVLGQLIPMDLPSFKELMKKFLSKIFKLFETTSSSSDNDFLNSLFRCTSELIRTYATYQDLTQPQVKTLVSIIKQHLNSSATQSNVFQCLRAIVYRKFVCPDLYDLIENVQDLMVTSIIKSTRGVCASIFTQFLLEYPLEAARVEQHINHLLKNLGYFDSEGRLQLLDVINSLIERFPKELTDQYAELIFFTLTLRTVNESNVKCRERVLQVIKRLILKASQPKSKTLFNTVIQMAAKEGTAQKKIALSQAKQMILGVFIEAYAAQIKLSDAQKIYEQCLHTLQEEALKIVEEGARMKAEKEQQQSDSEDEYDDNRIQNPEAKDFLRNIDLLEDEKKQMKQQEIQKQFAADFEEEKHQSEWSPLYYTLENIEKLLSAQSGDKPSVVSATLLKNHQNSGNLISNLLLVGLHHKTYWVRLAVQRVFGAVFSLQMRSDVSLDDALGLNEDKDTFNLLYKLANVFSYRPMVTDELGTQLVKNMTFLLKEVVTNEELKEQVSLVKLFSRCSFVARKMMLNVTEAKNRIGHVLLFFQVSLHLFESLNKQNEEDQEDEEVTGKDNALTRDVVQPILDLVYRIYTDDQYSDSRAKELAMELVDYLSTGLDKTFFINTYNDVKTGIHKKRLERKKLQKIQMASADGAKLKEKKRMRKALKKKEKKQAKKLHFEMRKN